MSGRLPGPPSMRRMLLLLLGMLLALPARATLAPWLDTPSLDTWRKRAIYQVVTDRFASPEQAPLEQRYSARCAVLNNYCGGTFRGLRDRLDYIRGLNLDAVWPSPVGFQAYGGYHGYWPTNLYMINSQLGTAEELQHVLQDLAARGVWNVLDVVLNHAGYGQGNIHLPAFNPFDKLTDYNDPARVPGGCDPYGDAPAVNATLEQTWQCQFAGLPDLNYTQLEVRKKAADWLNWFIGQFGTHLLRFDAAGHVQPDVWPWLLNQTEIKLPAVLEVGGGPKMVDLYEQLRGPVPYGYQNFDFQETSLACFARLVTPGDAGCRQLSDMRAAYARIGADTRRAVFFVDNHDTDRFLSVYDSEPAFRNALAHALLSEGIPSIYYGSEQGMKGVTGDNTHRAPLWERGFGATHPNYKFIRTLAWYRWWMRLDLADFKEVYVDRDTFAFSRGNRLLAILTAGYANTTGPGARAAGTQPATYRLANLGPFAGQRLCDALLSGICLDVTADGSASVPSSPTDEPLVLVPPGWVRSSDFFVPMQARPARWQTALIVSLVTTAGSALVAALGIWALACYRAGRWAPLADLRGMAVRLWARACCGRLLPWHKRPGAASSSGDTGSKADGSVGGTSPVGWGGPGDAELGKATPECLELERQATALDWAVARLASPSAVEQACAAAEEKPTDSHAPSWCLSGARIQRLQSLAQRRADTPVHLLIDCLKEDPHMVMHVALEYAVPHLGLKLTFGGLGQVVSDLTTHAVRPMLVCAPMYAPFYTDPEAGVLNQLLGEQPPVLSLPALVGGRKHLVDVYLTVTPPGQGPPVFFLLLASQLFSTRQPGTIYQHDSEATELAFFSVFNQAVAHVVETLGVTCLQFHDVHGALSVMHLPPEVPVRCLLMAHNFDYQSNWHLGTKEREAYVYSMLHIPLNSHTRSLCEHAGKFSLVRPLLKHFRLRQNGLGVVAVSPNYAARIAGKSSLLWGLPRSAIHGTLNGLEAGELGRPDLGAASPADLDSFFDCKQEAKLALQAAKGLQVGADFKLCSFMGRITHQKGCDLIALAARDILKGSRQAQLLMVGPIGDEYGERAKAMLEEVSADFPGRVSNLAGEYCRGAEKQQLLLATDFFFCPSRFEPCGLADIEFGWMGAVQIGHSTGGLGKMPGFYYTAQLDCVEEQSLRLAATALKALRAPDEEIRRLATQALAAEFPVSAMVAAYEREWSTLCALPRGRLHGAPAAMPAAEAAFYEQDWLEDNTPYIHQKASTERVQERHRRETKAWAANLLLVALQALLQLPSALSLIWLLNMKWAGSIQFSEAVTWGSIVRSPTAIYFFIYAGSALLAQALGLLLPPLHYMRLAALTFVASTLCVVWALYVPQAAEALYYVSASLAAAWLPISPFVFFDLKRASVSQHGPLILGFSDVLTNAAMVAGAAVALQQQGSTNINGFLGVSIVLLVVGTFYLAWLLCPNPLSRTFLYRRLRLRGQAALLLRQRKAWLFGVALTTMESFGFALLGSYSYSILASDDCRWFLLTASLTAMVGSGLLGALLASRPGRRGSVRLMYVLAASPLVLGIQLVLLVYGGTVGLYFAGTVFSALFVFSAAVTGLLTLHTVPTRETFALVKTLQVSLGSLAIVAGLVVGGVSANRTAGAWVAGVYELARLPLVAGLIWWHRRENLAGP